MLRHLITSALAVLLFAGLAACGGQSGSSNSSTSTAASSSAAMSNASSSNAAPITAPQGNLHLFATETEAQSVCPNDQIVWLNPKTGVYHEKGTRLYGHTKRGNYVCRKAADAAGDRDSKNG